MTIAGIISEFNPFHRGHMVPVEAAYKKLGAETAIVAIMSGNCVQRGELAIFHKLARAEAAVHCGVDLVIELPCPYVLGSAEPFARGGVSLLNAMGFKDTYLVFGCESDDLEGLSSVADALDSGPVQEAVGDGMRRGLSYGKACQRAIEDTGLTSEHSAMARHPNNLLAIEYIRAINRLHSSITPMPVMRKAVEHHSLNPKGEFASATHIRNLIHYNKYEDAQNYMPDPAAEVFRRELGRGRGPCSLEKLESAVLTILRLHSKPPERGFLDDSEGLSTRIVNMAARAESISELVELAKTKRYHASRIRRLILKMCLGMSRDDRPEMPPYLRILAANETGRRLIRQMDGNALLPVITQPRQIKRLNTRRILELESAVTDLQSLTFLPGARGRGGDEWRQSPYFSGI